MAEILPTTGAVTALPTSEWTTLYDDDFKPLYGLP